MAEQRINAQLINPDYSNSSSRSNNETSPTGDFFFYNKNSQLSPEDYLRPFIVDGSTKSIYADYHYHSPDTLDNIPTDYSQISGDHSRFCTLSSESQNSLFFGPKIFDKLNNFPSVATVSSAKEFLGEIYNQFNDPTAIETLGSFGVVINTPDKKTVAVIANCGGTIYLYRSNQNEIDFSANHLGQVSADKHSLQKLTPSTFSESLGGEITNPNYLSVTTVLLQPGDVFLFTPNKVNDKIDRRLLKNLSKTNDRPSSDIAKSSAGIIRTSHIEDTNQIKNATALVLSVTTSSNYIDDKQIHHEHTAPTLKEFSTAQSFDDLETIIRIKGNFRGLKRTYSSKEIIDLIYRGDLKSIPRAGGLRKTVERLINSKNSPSLPNQFNSSTIPTEII